MIKSGDITVLIGNKTICNCDIISKNNVEKKSFLTYLFEFLKNYNNYISSIK